LILHTSGTTGRPKMVPLTHRNLITSANHVVETYGLTPKDRTMLIMSSPYLYRYNIQGLVASFLSPLRSGGAIVLPPRLEPTFWDQFLQHHATWYSATPTMHSLLLNYPKSGSWHEICFIRSGSSLLSPAHYTDLEQSIGAPAIESYGMTGAGHMISGYPMPSLHRKLGSVGRVSGSIELCNLDSKGQAIIERRRRRDLPPLGDFRASEQGYLDDEGHRTSHFKMLRLTSVLRLTSLPAVLLPY
ncbi:acetyl-CoA synthetase-like protein, partial [Setomelanomma holmii]